MDKQELIDVLVMLIDANQCDVNESENDRHDVQWSEEDHAFYRGKITAYRTILDVLVEGK